MKTYKSTVVSFLAFCTIIMFVLPASSTSANEKDVMQKVNSYLQWNMPVNVEIDNKPLSKQGIMMNSKIYVPFRSVFEATGAKVTWDSSTRTAKAVGNGWYFEQRLKNSNAILNNGSLMIPVREAASLLEREMKWNSKNRTLRFLDPPLPKLSVTSKAFDAFENIPQIYAYSDVPGGENVSIPIQWDGAPTGTKSYVIVMYDLHPVPDNFIHWGVINIPSSVKSLDEGASNHLKKGLEVVPYYGPQPPMYSGDHQYRIAVYALDQETIELDKHGFIEDIESTLLEHSLAYGYIDGYFK